MVLKLRECRKLGILLFTLHFSCHFAPWKVSWQWKENVGHKYHTLRKLTNFVCKCLHCLPQQRTYCVYINDLGTCWYLDAEKAKVNVDSFNSRSGIQPATLQLVILPVSCRLVDSYMKLILAAGQCRPCCVKYHIWKLLKRWTKLWCYFSFTAPITNSSSSDLKFIQWDRRSDRIW